MKTSPFTTSSCRHCRYYQAEGRRGGMCHQLSVPVQGDWSACTLAARPFNNAWESLEEVVRLEHSLQLTYQNESGDKKVSAPSPVSNTPVSNTNDKLPA